MKKKKHIIFLVIVLILSLCSVSFADGIINEKTNEKLSEFKGTMDYYGTILLAFGLATSVLILIIHFIRLGKSYNHPILRQEIIRDIAVTLIITSLMGGIGLVVKLTYASFM